MSLAASALPTEPGVKFAFIEDGQNHLSTITASVVPLSRVAKLTGRASTDILAAAGPPAVVILQGTAGPADHVMGEYQMTKREVNEAPLYALATSGANAATIMAGAYLYHSLDGKWRVQMDKDDEDGMFDGTNDNLALVEATVPTDLPTEFGLGFLVKVCAFGNDWCASTVNAYVPTDMPMKQRMRYKQKRISMQLDAVTELGFEVGPRSEVCRHTHAH